MKLQGRKPKKGEVRKLKGWWPGGTGENGSGGAGRLAIVVFRFCCLRELPTTRVTTLSPSTTATSRVRLCPSEGVIQRLEVVSLDFTSFCRFSSPWIIPSCGTRHVSRIASSGSIFLLRGIPRPGSGSLSRFSSALNAERGDHVFMSLGDCRHLASL